jgi:hypothetical protein
LLWWLEVEVPDEVEEREELEEDELVECELCGRSEAIEKSCS